MKSVINTNDAYLLATNWLSAIAVDVSELENTHPPSVEQLFFYPDAASPDDSAARFTRKVFVPIYHVFWGNVTNPIVKVSIFGPTKELLSIQQEDDSFSRRPRILIKDVDRLLKIPDAEFQKYSEVERQQLISRFRATDDVANCPTNSAATNSVSPVRILRDLHRASYSNKVEI